MPDGTGGLSGQTAVSMNPRAPLAVAYLATIAPLRYAIVCSPQMPKTGRDWGVGACVVTGCAW